MLAVLLGVLDMGRPDPLFMAMKDVSPLKGLESLRLGLCIPSSNPLLAAPSVGYERSRSTEFISIS